MGEARVGAAKTGQRKGFLHRVKSGMKSLAGIMAAFATIATAAATILGLVVHQQATQLQEVRVTVRQQAAQLQQLKSGPSSTSTAAPSSSGTSGGSSVPLGTGGRYLSDLSPTVDNAIVDTGQQVIAARQYTKSLLFYCEGGNGDQPDAAYDVAGSSTFTATVGIPDNMQDATDVIATVTFTNESDQRAGQPVQVSLGHPAKVDIPISGVTQLGMTCVGRDARSGEQATSFQIAIGDAHISP